MKKLKTYVLTVSRKFPATHPEKGKPTLFVEKVLNALIPFGLIDNSNTKQHQLEFTGKDKIHTIRGNYELWKKRIDEVKKGNAVLSLRYWSGKPYKSKQVEFAGLDQMSDIGVQKLIFKNSDFNLPMIAGKDLYMCIDSMAYNDGLNDKDFRSWFEKYNLSNPMAIIHFSDFRY